MPITAANTGKVASRPLQVGPMNPAAAVINATAATPDHSGRRVAPGRRHRWKTDSWPLRHQDQRQQRRIGNRCGSHRVLRYPRDDDRDDGAGEGGEHRGRQPRQASRADRIHGTEPRHRDGAEQGSDRRPGSECRPTFERNEHRHRRGGQRQSNHEATERATPSSLHEGRGGDQKRGQRELQQEDGHSRSGSGRRHGAECPAHSN